MKLAKTRNHLKFNLRCTNMNVMPFSLDLPCPVMPQRSRDIVEKAMRGLPNERNGQKVLKMDIVDRQKKLFLGLPCDNKENVTVQITTLIMKSCERAFFNNEKWMGKQTKHMEEEAMDTAP